MPNSPFEPLVFSNRFVQELPGDPIPDNFVRRIQGAAYSRVNPVSYTHLTLPTIYSV